MNTIHEWLFFCDSDEEEEDTDALFYLPVSPEIEDDEGPLPEQVSTVLANQPLWKFCPLTMPDCCIASSIFKY